MANLFQLPCPSCDHQLEVSTRQAGQTLQCSGCGVDVEAPTLGAIKQLNPADVPEPGTKGAMSNARKGLFTVGLALAVVLGCAGAGVHLYANSLHVPIDVPERLREIREDLQKATPIQIYDLANDMVKNNDLGEYKEPAFLTKNKQGAILQYFAWGLYGFAGAGLLMLVGSFLMK